MGDNGGNLEHSEDRQQENDKQPADCGESVFTGLLDEGDDLLFHGDSDNAQDIGVGVPNHPIKAVLQERLKPIPCKEIKLRHDEKGDEQRPQ